MSSGSTIEMQVNVKNSFSGKAASIALVHQFKSKPTETKVWTNVASGAITDPVTVTRSSDAGHDYWWMTVTLADGTVYYKNDKTCTIESSDGDTVQTHVVKKDSWTIPLVSGGCSTGLSILND